MISPWSGRNTGKKVMTLSDPVFRSKLRDDLEAFISQKRASGYPYHTSSKVLGYLDTMIAEDYPDCSTLSKEICDAWIRKCSVLHQNTLLRRVTPVRQFAKYLVGTGKSAYIIPSGIPSAICAARRPLVRLPAATRRSPTATFIKVFR